MGTTQRDREAALHRAGELERRMQELQDSGISWDLSWWMVYHGMTLEQAQKREAQFAKESDTRPRGGKYRERVNFEERRRMSGSYWRGSEAGEKVGLDVQVGNKTTGRLT